MNADLEPFQDLRVRQAFNHAIGVSKGLRDAVFQGLAEPAETLIAPIIERVGFGRRHLRLRPRRGAQAAGGGRLCRRAGGRYRLFRPLHVGSKGAAVQAADQLRDAGIQATPRRITASDMRASAAPSRSRPAPVRLGGRSDRAGRGLRPGPARPYRRCRQPQRLFQPGRGRGDRRGADRTRSGAPASSTSARRRPCCWPMRRTS